MPFFNWFKCTYCDLFFYPRLSNWARILLDWFNAWCTIFRQLNLFSRSLFT